VLAQFVGQLATSDVALIILTPAYAGTETKLRTWMFEEWQRIEGLRTCAFMVARIYPPCHE
jgi:hypothetical protein